MSPRNAVFCGFRGVLRDARWKIERWRVVGPQGDVGAFGFQIKVFGFRVKGFRGLGCRASGFNGCCRVPTEQINKPRTT